MLPTGVIARVNGVARLFHCAGPARSGRALAGGAGASAESAGPGPGGAGVAAHWQIDFRPGDVLARERDQRFKVNSTL